MDKQKSKIILGILCTIVVIVAAIEMVWNWRMVKELLDIPRVHAIEHIAEDAIEFETISDKAVPSVLWESDGYEDFDTWAVDLREIKSDSIGIAQDAINEWGKYLDEEEQARLQAIEDEIQTLNSITEINALLEEFHTIIEECKPAPASTRQPVSSTPSYNSGGSSGSFKQMGVVYDDNYRYTWYSQNVLPGGGLNIPGRHVNSENFVCDENGYIVVAADPDTLKYGAVIETPFGTAKVYDTGCAPGTVDVYTNY